MATYGDEALDIIVSAMGKIAKNKDAMAAIRRELNGRDPTKLSQDEIARITQVAIRVAQGKGK